VAIDYFSSTNPLRKIASAISLRARKRMFAYLMKTIPFDASTKVIDVGVTPDDRLPESNFFEALYPYPHNVTATSIEDASNLERAFPGVRFVRTSGVELPFPDQSFDVAVSFAVLEHVGDREHQRQFLGELVRVARTVFITTPDRRFPVELHTFLPLVHWLPQPVHQRILRTLGMEFWAKTENLNLLNASELSDLTRSVGVATSLERHRLLGLSSNLLLHLRR